mgnify:CR=1 FL=1
MSKKGVEDMKRVLIVVDVQNDFVDGVLGSKEAQAIIPAVKAKIEKYDKYGKEILFTRDSHDVDYLYTSEGRNCLLNTALWGLADIELSMVLRHIIADILISRHSDMRDGLRC